jgi:AraC-like DNA-binding protein
VAVLLDTRELSPTDRAGAFMDSWFTPIPMGRIIDEEQDGVDHRVEGWIVAPGCSVLRDEGTALRLVRGPRELRLAAPEATTLTFQLGPRGMVRSRVRESVGRMGALSVVDLTSYCEYQWWGVGGHESLTIDNDVLGLPVDVIRRASERPLEGPLPDLLRTHLSTLLRSEFEAVAQNARGMLATACVELARAVIATAGSGPDARPGAARSVLVMQIEEYIADHLAERDLHAERIALAHNVSLRQLYNVWNGHELSLAEHIIAARLEAARTELARADPAHLAIGAVALRWGFSDVTHFSRRFRAAYGLPPREWYQARSAMSSGPDHS